MSESELTIDGRPDFGNWSFGHTKAKKHPKYVYSISHNSCLVHKVAEIEMGWYEVAAGGHKLVRRKNPRVYAYTVCGMTKFISGIKAASKPSVLCAMPTPDAILCGRCEGTVATFGRINRKNIKLTRKQAHFMLGCLSSPKEYLNV